VGLAARQQIPENDNSERSANLNISGCVECTRRTQTIAIDEGDGSIRPLPNYFGHSLDIIANMPVRFQCSL